METGADLGPRLPIEHGHRSDGLAADRGEITPRIQHRRLRPAFVGVEYDQVADCVVGSGSEWKPRVLRDDGHALAESVAGVAESAPDHQVVGRRWIIIQVN